MDDATFFPIGKHVLCPSNAAHSVMAGDGRIFSARGNSMSEARFAPSSVHRSTFSTDGIVPRQPPVLAKAEAEPDPIFAIIKEHDAAMRGESACLLWQSVLEKNLPANRRAWRFGASSEPPESTDAPEWIASQMAVGEAKDRRAKAIVSCYAACHDGRRR